MRRRNLLIASILITFVALRGFLHSRPDADLNVASYNIHHLFTGVLVLTIFGVPAVLWRNKRELPDRVVAGFGVGLGLTLDEWFYLIVTDGSNLAYTLPISFWSATALISLACVYVLLVARRVSRPAE